MNVLLASTQDTGGAARACIRLHEGLLAAGTASTLLLLHRTHDDIPAVAVLGSRGNKLRRLRRKVRRFFWERRNSQITSGRREGFDVFSHGDGPFDLECSDAVGQADVINLHWVADFLNYSSFFRRNRKPVAWTLHDMNPFTGGCHYSGECDGHRAGCGTCPQLEGGGNPLFARGAFVEKLRALHAVPDAQLVIVALSQWMMKQSSSSRLFSRFDHRLIPNGIDKNVFRPMDKSMCRDFLGLPQDRRIVAFVGDDLANERKGYRFFQAAMERLGPDHGVGACVVGRRSGTRIAREWMLEIGPVRDERVMNAVYSAADAYVITSTEDNLPNTVMESLLSGTPVAGFAVGGVPDMVVHGMNGRLVAAGAMEGLVRAVLELLALGGHAERLKIREDAVRRFDIAVQVRAYSALYEEMAGRFGFA